MIIFPQWNNYTNINHLKHNYKSNKWRKIHLSTTKHLHYEWFNNNLHSSSNIKQIHSVTTSSSKMISFCDFKFLKLELGTVQLLYDWKVQDTALRWVGLY